MKRGRKWWLIRLGIPLLAGLALFGWALSMGSQSAVILENQSGQVVTQAEVVRGGQSTAFKEIPAGGKVTAVFKGAGAFSVDGRLADGTLIRARFGDLGPRADLVIAPGGQITVRKTKD